MTRLLLLDTFLRRGDIVAATDEITALSGIAPRAGGLLIGEMARLAQSPETTGALEQALKKNPMFRDRLLGDRGADVVTFHDWQRIEAAEAARAREGSPREKFVAIADMLRVGRG